MSNFLNGKNAAMMLALSLVNVTAAFAQDDNSSAKEEGNRNVMLNAASANGPREIQIGLPSADVNVLENGLPVTYATNPHSVNTIWRGDASLSHQGLHEVQFVWLHLSRASCSYNLVFVSSVGDFKLCAFSHT